MRLPFLSILIPLLAFASCEPVSFEDWSSRPISYQFINMKKDVERSDRMLRQFDSAGINAHRIDAVVGRDLSPEQLYKLIQTGVTLRPGEIGIYLSYLEQAIVNAASAQAGEITVTFEDDVAISPYLESKFRSALRQVPGDWDILYLGCNQNSHIDTGGVETFDPYFPKRSLEPRHQLAPLCRIESHQKVNGTPWSQLDDNCTAGAWALALNPISAQKLQKMLLPIREPIDLAIKRLIGKSEIRAYCLSPELVSVDLSTSSTKPK